MPLAGLLRGARGSLALLVLSVLLLAPGITALPPLDRDEARFVQSSRQMLESGDLVDLRFQDEPRYKKPAGIYWLQAASAALFGGPSWDRVWAYRLPSLLGAVIAVLLTYRIGLYLFDPPAAFLGALLLCASLLLGLEARQAKTDAVLLAATLITQLGLVRLYTGHRAGSVPGTGPAVMLWIAIGAGILIKGPIIVLVVGLTALALALTDKDRAWIGSLRPLLGLAIVALLTGPWLAAIAIKSSGTFLSESLGRDLSAKILGEQESHGAPPGYYLTLFPLTFWPGSLIALLSIPWVWAHRAAPSMRLCLCWIVPAWIVFEAVPTKLPHYVLPTYPAIALLAAAWAWQTAKAKPGDRARRAWATTAGIIWTMASLALAGALAAVSYVADRRIDAIGVLLGIAVVAATLASWRIREQRRRALASVAAAFVVLPLTFQALLPGLDGLWVSRSLREAIAQTLGPGPHSVASAGFSEPSLVFLLGRQTRFVDGASAAHLLLEGTVEAAIVTDREDAAFRAATERAGPVERIARVGGINYSKGQRLTAGIYRKLE